MAKAVRKTPDTGLGRPWASSPGVPPRYAIKAYNTRTDRMYAINSYSCYPMVKVLNQIAGGKEGCTFQKVSANVINYGHIRIQSDELPEITAHQLTDLEREWQLPESTLRDIERFVHGTASIAAIDDFEIKGRVLAILKEGARTLITGRMPSAAPAQSQPPKASFPHHKVKAATDDLGAQVSAFVEGDAAKLKKFAIANDCWDPKYDALPSAGLRRMNVVNRLRAKVRKGYKVKW